METCDVLIVGSGPAGAAAARVLKSSSLKVVMAERKMLPRDKMCSGLVIPAAQDVLSQYFGVTPESCYSTPKAINTVRIFLPDDSVVDVPRESYRVKEFADILSVWRDRFDSWLANESGADIREGWRFVGLMRDGDELVAKLRSDGKDITLKTRYVIGADGGNSGVRRWAAPDYCRQERLLQAYEEYWKGGIDLEPEYFYHFNNEAFSQGLFAAFSIKDDYLISVSSARLGSNVRKLHKTFIDYLKSAHNFIPATLTHSGGCLLNYRGSAEGLFDFGKGNVLLAGEAGGFMRALSEGITPALKTGLAAGRAVIESVKSGVEAVEPYAEFAREEIEVIKAQHAELQELKTRGEKGKEDYYVYREQDKRGEVGLNDLASINRGRIPL